MNDLPIYVQGAWFLGAALFISASGHEFAGLGPQGIVIAGYGMLIAIAATFLIPGLQNLGLMALPWRSAVLQPGFPARRSR